MWPHHIIWKVKYALNARHTNTIMNINRYIDVCIQDKGNNNSNNEIKMLEKHLNKIISEATDFYG